MSSEIGFDPDNLSEEFNEEEKPFFIWGGWSQNITTPLKMDFTQPAVIKKVVLGRSFAILLDGQGCIWSWGFNECGCLGIKIDTKVAKTPQKVTMPEGAADEFKDVAVGSNHVLAVSNNGELWAWGDNSKQQLGIGKHEGEKIWTPFKVDLAVECEIEKIYACLNSSYFITIDGEVYAWGNNNDGQLGLSCLVDVEVPKKIENLPPISELVIREKQVIAMQFIKDNASQSGSDTEQAPEMQKLEGEGTRSVSQMKSQENEPMQRLESNLFSRKESTIIERKESTVHELQRGNTTHSKSVRSSSQRSFRSSKSGASSKYKYSQPLDKLTSILKECIPIVFDLYGQFKQIDDEIEKINTDKNFEKIHGNPAKDLITKIKVLREECHEVFEEKLSIERLEEDKENLDVKKFIGVLRNGILDSLAVRTLQSLGIWMQNCRDLLKSQSFINLSAHTDKEKTYISDEKMRYACLYHCAKVQKNIKENSKTLKNMTIGLSNSSCLVFDYMYNVLIEQIQLWVGINNLTADISKLNSKEVKYKRFNSVMDSMWEAHKVIRENSLDNIYKVIKFDRKKYESPEVYLADVINASQKKIKEQMNALEEIKNNNANFFTRQMRSAYEVIWENFHLRELLNESNRKLLIR